MLRQESGHDSDIQAANVRVRQCDATIKSAKRLMEEAEEDAIKASQVLQISCWLVGYPLAFVSTSWHCKQLQVAPSAAAISAGCWLMQAAAQVVCVTLSGAGDQRLGSTRFKIVILDEASQATEPSTLIPLVIGPVTAYRVP